MYAFMADVGQEEVCIHSLVVVCHALTWCRTSRPLVSKHWALAQRSSSLRYNKYMCPCIDPCLHIYIQDLKREFITELIYPAVQANCIYEVLPRSCELFSFPNIDDDAR